MRDDFERLNRMLDDLAAERAPADARDLDADDLPLLETAALLKNASPSGAEPDPEFVARLGERLAAAAGAPPEAVAADPAPIPPASPAVPSLSGVTRRRLLGRAAFTLAGLAAGAGADEVLHRDVDQAAAAYDRGRADGYREAVSGPYTAPLAPQARGKWMDTGHTVDAIAPGHAVRFRAGAIEGFLVNPGDGKPIYAVSAACTHMGCLLAWLETTGTFVCPCHGAQYRPDGTVLTGIARHPLPHIAVRSGVDGALQVWSVAQHRDATAVVPYSLP
jgi:Rieske Fe-S protein